MGQNPVIEHSTIGALQMHGLPFQLGLTPARLDHSSPTLGQHTDEVLREAGLEPAEIDTLRRDNVIR